MNYKRLFINGTYVFLTIVTYNRKKFLIDNVNLLKEAFSESKNFFNFEIFAICILPEHFHIILNPENINDYPKIIKSIKYNFSNNINAVGLASPTYGYENKREKGIWQRRYYEHTIKDEEDLNKHLDYIHYNPVKHNYVSIVNDWKYSSFDKFVKQGNYYKNWGMIKDVEKIKDLNYE